jgi:hypothetical protein
MVFYRYWTSWDTSWTSDPVSQSPHRFTHRSGFLNYGCEVSVLPIGSCRTGAGTGAPAHLLGSPTRRLDFGAAVQAVFWPRAQFPRRPCFGKRFGAVDGDALMGMVCSCFPTCPSPPPPPTGRRVRGGRPPPGLYKGKGCANGRNDRDLGVGRDKEEWAVGSLCHWLEGQEDNRGVCADTLIVWPTAFLTEIWV